MWTQIRQLWGGLTRRRSAKDSRPPPRSPSSSSGSRPAGGAARSESASPGVGADKAGPRSGSVQASIASVPPALPSPRRAPSGSPASPLEPPTLRKQANHLVLAGLDVEQSQAKLAERETEILNRIAVRIREGRFDLPQMPATSVTVLNLTSRSSAEINEIVRAIEADPVLTSELIKTANSVLYAGVSPAETIAQAIMRIGLRDLRTLMFSVSVRGVVLRDKRFAKYGEEVWRQSYSMASIARALAKVIGAEPDRAFLHGLLADIGKVSLLSMLRQELAHAAHAHLAVGEHDGAGHEDIAAPA